MHMDPIADMITTILNAGAVGKKTAVVPFSKQKAAIAKSLLDKEYIAGYEKVTKGNHPALSIELRYVQERPRIAGAKRVSRLSRRVYYRVKNILPVRYGYGDVIMSTPKGIMTGKDAKNEQVGGEALFEIW